MPSVDEKPESSGGKADLAGGTSTLQTSATKSAKMPTNTACVAPSVSFWRDSKFWIQIAVMGILQSAFWVYMDNAAKNNIANMKSALLSDILSNREFKDLFDGDLKERKTKLPENLDNKIKDKLTQLTEDLEYVKSEMKGILTSVNKEWEKREEPIKHYLNGIIEEKATQLTENMENIKSEMKGEWEKREQTLEGDFNEIIEEKAKQLTKHMENVKSEIKGELTSMKKEWDKREQTVKDDFSAKIEEKAAQLIQTLENVKSEMKGDLTSLNRKWEEREETLKGDLSGKIEETKETLRLFHKKFEGVDGQLNHFYSEIGGISNYIVVFFLAMVIGGIICINKFMVSRQRPLERTPHSGGQGLKSLDTITERLKREGIRNGTLIISFHPSTQQFHWNLLDAVSAYLKSTPLNIVIQNADDLMNVQPQKLVIIFVDFNDRNIILENEESEIGDLRNQITKVFMSLGCAVFVVYCKDLGSRDLKQNSLFNARLNCIDRHPVLSELKTKNRILSINDKFHPHQVEYLRNCFQKL